MILVCSRTQRDHMQQNHMLLPPSYKHCCSASRVRAPFDLVPKLACRYRRIPFNFSQSHMLKCKRRVSNLVKTASKASKEYATVWRCSSFLASPFIHEGLYSTAIPKHITKVRVARKLSTFTTIDFIPLP